MGFSKDDDIVSTAIVGMSGGVTAAIVGHPFDTIKTRLQTGRPLWTRGKSIFRSLTRGLTAPLMSVPPSWVANFGSYSVALKYTGDDTVASHYLAGGISGLAWALAVTPFELIKCRAQRDGTSSTFEIRKLLQNRHSASIVGAAYKGLQLAMLRDFIGCGMWFAVYHINVEKLQLGSFVSGGLAGVSCWTTILPLDLIKTHYQTESGATLGDSLRYASRRMKGGGLWSGLYVTIVRQFIQAGMSMVVAEEVRLLLQDA